MISFISKISKRKKIAIIIFICLLIAFWAYLWSQPSEWFKWDEWTKHIQENHT